VRERKPKNEKRLGHRRDQEVTGGEGKKQSVSEITTTTSKTFLPENKFLPGSLYTIPLIKMSVDCTTYFCNAGKEKLFHEVYGNVFLKFILLIWFRLE
jgi:hypothetical protein